MRLTACWLLAALAAAPHGASAQACDEEHVRWTEKTDAGLAEETAKRTTIGTMLKWTVPAWTSSSAYRCQDREGKELNVYSVAGWVRRIKKGEGDGDWHIELTATKSGDVKNCIIVEIPPAELDPLFEQARLDLDWYVPDDELFASGDVVEPIKVRFIGPAFFDNEHRGGASRRDKTDGSHGRCNASVRALWEIHPVYWVTDP